MSKDNRLGPHSLEAEMAVLGAILIEPTVLDDLPPLTPDDFWEVKHGWIFKAMLALNEEGLAIDPLTVNARLKAMGRLDDVGVLYVNELMASTPTHVYAPTYAEVVRQASVRRALMTAAGKIANAARDENLTLEQALAEAEALINALSLSEDRSGLERYADGVERLIEKMHEARMSGEGPGLPTGIAALDQIMGGLERGGLYILAGRPGVGKTAYALNIADNVSRVQSVLFVSLEMSTEQLTRRLISSATGLAHHKLRYPRLMTEQDFETVAKYYVDAQSMRLYIADPRASTLPRIRAESRMLARRDGLDLIIIDYLQLIKPDKRYAGNRVQEIAQISGELKDLARSLNIPVLALSQLNRAGDTTNGDRPRLRDLRDSGSLEQDADGVILLSRQTNGVLVDVAKNRHDAPGEYTARWDGAIQRFA